MALISHPELPHAQTIPLQHFDDSATFGDFFQHYRHRCLGYHRVGFPFDILQDTRPSRIKPNGVSESIGTRDIPLASKQKLSRSVGGYIHFTRNTGLIRPAIRKLCEEARETPLPPVVIDILNVRRWRGAYPAYRDEQQQSKAFEHEVYEVLNEVIDKRAECLPDLEVIGPYEWCQIEPASAGKSSDGGFGQEAVGALPKVVKISKEDKRHIVIESKSSMPDSMSLLEELIHFGDTNFRYPRSRVYNTTATIDKVIRQASCLGMLDNVTTRVPVLYIISSYNRMLVLKVRPPTVEEPYTKVEVGEEYLRYPVGDIYPADGTFSHDRGIVSMATALLAMSFRPRGGPAWDWEDDYTWPTEEQIHVWMESLGKIQKPLPDPRGNKARASHRSEAPEDSPLHLITFFPHEADRDCLYRKFFLDGNTSFEAITQPNHPWLRRRLRLQLPSGINRDMQGVSLPTSPLPSPSLTFGRQIGRGHLGVVFAGKLSVNGETSIEVAVKLVMPGAFHSKMDGPLPVDGDGYTRLSSEDAERLIKHEARVYDQAIALQGKVIPQCLGLWHGYCLELDGAFNELGIYMLITELLSEENPSDETSILSAYDQLHNAGITHGDVERRHWKSGRIFDLERAILKPTVESKNKLSVYQDPDLIDTEGVVTLSQWKRLVRDERKQVQYILAGQDDDVY